jgi:Tol biopolymer transport system component
VRITHGPAPGIFPVWSPDGNHLAYLDGNPPGRPGRKVLAIAAADGTGRVRTLPCPGSYCEPTDWTPDGRHLIVTVRDTRGADVWMVPAEAGAPPQPLLAAAFAEHDARVSPDGRWIAYVSNESGRPEVSVRSMSGAPTRIVLSGVGGSQPVWRRDGAELFFVDPQGRLRSVTVRQTGNGPTTFGLPVELNVPRIGAGHWGTQYDVSPDGRSVYFLPRNEDPAPRDIHVVIGWRALLE